MKKYIEPEVVVIKMASEDIMDVSMGTEGGQDDTFT